MWKFLQYGPRLFVVKLISVYQKTLSFDHGPARHLYPNGFCRFQPSCSEYGKEAILKYGVVWGGLKAVWRILRCNPWSKGGYDPLQ
ncbi:MAG: membrane protein insertion efficiency factor YidD [Candidatus Falkowbacteria bacterium]|nr:membrane protein insertion efficiency factor YidD [Candidatus Falkowbacteria bacterium]